MRVDAEGTGRWGRRRLTAPARGSESQGLGIGRVLVEAAIETARAAGVDGLVLVTPPDFAARDFYEHLGWSADGEMCSRSGEIFIRYRLSLFGKAPKGADRADAGGSSPITC